MKEIPGYLVLPFGAIIGTFLISLPLRALKQAQLAAKSKDRLGLIFATLFNPQVLIFPAALIFLALYFARNPPAGSWLWFLWGAIVGPPVLYGLWLVSPGRRRILKKREQRNDNHPV